jgi:serine/threonine-protein kinase
LDGTCAVKVLAHDATYCGVPCIVMEHLRGVDLETRLTECERSDKKLSFVEVRTVLEPLVETLHRAHELGIVHRDLKPANIFLLEDGGVRLIDFGFARLESEARMTAFGVVMGSPCYIAPEVWQGHADKSGVSVDVYSFAVIVFRMLGGSPPFETQSLVEMRELATTAARPSLCALRPDLASGVDQWVKRGLAVDPAARFASLRVSWEALCDAAHQQEPRNWGLIPRAFAEKVYPRRMADALRKAGAVLWRGVPGPSLDAEAAAPEVAPKSVPSSSLRRTAPGSSNGASRKRRRRKKGASKQTRKARQARRRARAKAS